jgi:hypothetical protein
MKLAVNFPLEAVIDFIFFHSSVDESFIGGSPLTLNSNAPPNYKIFTIISRSGSMICSFGQKRTLPNYLFADNKLPLHLLFYHSRRRYIAPFYPKQH